MQALAVVLALKSLVSLLVRKPLKSTIRPHFKIGFMVEQGAKVTAHYNTNSSTLQPLISQYGTQQIQALQANLVEEDTVAKLFQDATSALGAVQILILNHAISCSVKEPLLKISLERWRNIIDVNLTSSFIVTKEYLNRLEAASSAIKDMASVIIIGSTAGKFGLSKDHYFARIRKLTSVPGEAGNTDYAASKSGQHTFNQIPLLIGSAQWTVLIQRLCMDLPCLSKTRSSRSPRKRE